MALTTQLFNDRVTIDVSGSNTNTLNQQQNTNSIVGEFNAEYKISNDGKLKLRGFNKANDNTSLINNSPYKQGVGVFYREEFNTLGDLIQMYLNKLKRKKKEPKSIE